MPRIKIDERLIRKLENTYVRLDDCFAENTVYELDLGCGTGAFTVELAARYPERTVYASDIMLGRLRKVVKRYQTRGISNLIPLRVESRCLLGFMIPDGAIDRLHLLCPDPWPKEKHRAQRLLASDFIPRIHRVLKKDGIFHFSSDDVPYFEWGCRHINESKLFEAAPEGIADISDVTSDFEKRWQEQEKNVRHAAWRALPLPPKTIGH